MTIKEKLALWELYDRTMENCLFYMEQKDDAALLNEIGCLRGIAYCMEKGGELLENPADCAALKMMIEKQQALKSFFRS